MVVDGDDDDAICNVGYSKDVNTEIIEVDKENYCDYAACREG